EGLSADASSEQIADAVRAGLRPDAMMLGFSPEAVAIAVRRALGVARTWRDFEWQIVEMPAVSPAMHLALDEVLAKEVAAGRRTPGADAALLGMGTPRHHHRRVSVAAQRSRYGGNARIWRRDCPARDRRRRHVR